MAIQKLNLGLPVTGEGGDTYRQANTKINENFTTIDSKVNSLGGGKLAYTTYALMLADKANIKTNASIDVNNDSDATKNGNYSYNGINFIKSDFNIEDTLLSKVANTFNTYDDLINSTLPNLSYAVVTNNVDLDYNGYFQKLSNVWVKNSNNPIRQTEKLLDSIVKFNVNDNDIIDPSINLYSNVNSVNDFYVHGTSQILNKLETTLNIIPVKEGESYLFKADVKTNYINISFNDTDNIADGQKLILATVTETTKGFKKVTVPIGYKFMLFNTRLNPITALDIRTTLVVNKDSGTVNKIGEANIIDAQAREVLKSTLNKTDKIILEKPSNLAIDDIYGYYVTNGGSRKGQTSIFEGTAMRKFPVEAGKTYSVYSTSFVSNVFTLALGDNDRVASGEQKTVIDLQATDNESIKTFTVPIGMTWGFVGTYFPFYEFDIRLSLWINEGIENTKNTADTLIGLDGNLVRDSFAHKRIDTLTNTNQNTSVLNGKKWVAIGDSITAVNPTANKKYHNFISESVDNLTVYNYGIGGTGYYDRYAVADTVTQIDADYLTIFWGTNDYGNQKATNKKPLGTFLDNDSTTISGCINLVFKSIQTKFYKQKVGIITPLPRLNNWGENAAPNAYGYTLEQLVNLIIRYCNHYSIPYLDLYHNSDLPVWIPQVNIDYFTAPDNSVPDGLHPNDLGHLKFANKVKDFLESL